MGNLQTIKATYVHPRVEEIDGGFALQFAGFSNKKIEDFNRLRTWSLPFPSKQEAKDKIEEFSQAIKQYGFMIVFNAQSPKSRTKANA